MGEVVNEWLTLEWKDGFVERPAHLCSSNSEAARNTPHGRTFVHLFANFEFTGSTTPISSPLMWTFSVSTTPKRLKRGLVRRTTRLSSSIIALPRHLRKPLGHMPFCPTQVGTPCKQRRRDPFCLATWTGWQMAVSAIPLPTWAFSEKSFSLSDWATCREKGRRETENAHRSL